MDIPKRLYHYTRREVALEKILPQRALKLGSLGETNDPREMQEWGFPVGNIPAGLDISAMDKEGRLLFLEEMNVLQREANCIRLEEWWFLSLSCDDPDLVAPDLTRPDFSHFKYGYARSRIWAQYAQDHAGICLEFDGPALDKAIRSASQTETNVFCGRVEYHDEFNLRRAVTTNSPAFMLDYSAIQKLGGENGLRAHIRKHYDSFFLEKTPEWASEQEFRWLVNESRDPHDPILVDISTALTAVIVGVKFPSVYEPSVRVLCDSLGVRLERMTWSNRVPHKQLWEVSA